jgi:hypothetical protein
MKHILLIFLCIFLINIAICDESDTSLDSMISEEYAFFEDDDFGYIDPNIIEKKVFIVYDDDPLYFGEEVTLIAVLMDFPPADYNFIWEFSENGKDWSEIENENEQTYTFILNKCNSAYHWRVTVILQEESI